MLACAPAVVKAAVWAVVLTGAPRCASIDHMDTSELRPHEILRLKIERKFKTQSEAARQIGINRRRLNGLCNGDRPRGKELEIIEKELGLSPDLWA